MQSRSLSRELALLMLGQTSDRADAGAKGSLAAEAPLELFWFYKAGFAAALILESRKEWPEAIRVYGLMAAMEGPRALEAKNRIKQIRLENFIWDDD